MFDVTQPATKESIQALIEGLDEVCKKVVDNPTRLYDMNNIYGCVIGVNYSPLFTSEMSKIFKAKYFKQTYESLSKSGMSREYVEVNKLFIGMDRRSIMLKDDWLLKAGTVRTYLEMKLEQLC